MEAIHKDAEEEIATMKNRVEAVCHECNDSISTMKNELESSSYAQSASTINNSHNNSSNSTNSSASAKPINLIEKTNSFLHQNTSIQKDDLSVAITITIESVAQ